MYKEIGGRRLVLKLDRPVRVALPGTGGRVLALGAEMAGSYCVWEGGRALVSETYGPLSELGNLEAFRKAVGKVRPDAVLSDLHPGYASSVLAEEFGCKQVKVQHHVAHAYGAAAEQGLDDFAAVVCDGLGYGSDGTIWGGEVFDNDRRVGHLEPQVQLGGDAATKEPRQMAASILFKFLDEKEAGNLISLPNLGALRKVWEDRFNSPMTTSCGRVLDAASALLGFSKERTFEGSPAILLEKNSTKPYDLQPKFKGDTLLTTPLFEWLVENIGRDRARLGATVQLYLAEGLQSIAAKMKKQIIFSGGCAYNTIMTSFMLGKGVGVSTRIPAGDGGIAFGQVAYHLRK